MKLCMFLAFTLLNILISGGALLTLAAASNDDSDHMFNSGLARIAVQQRLDGIASVTASIPSRLSHGCVERKRDDNGLVVGRGEAVVNNRLFEGVPVKDATQFQYRAAVSSRCGGYNLHCYSVDNIDVAGSRSISPKL